MTADIACIWPAGAVLGEGPLWDEREGRLYWVDIKAPAVHRYSGCRKELTDWRPGVSIGTRDA